MDHDCCKSIKFERFVETGTYFRLLSSSTALSLLSIAPDLGHIFVGITDISEFSGANTIRDAMLVNVVSTGPAEVDVEKSVRLLNTTKGQTENRQLGIYIIQSWCLVQAFQSRGHARLCGHYGCERHQ